MNNEVNENTNADTNQNTDPDMSSNPQAPETQPDQQYNQQPPQYNQQPPQYNQQPPQYNQQPPQYNNQPPQYNNQPNAPKSRVAAGLLGIFLGAFGVHNFYLGYTGKAVAQLLIALLTCGLGTPITGLWGLIEGILILTGSIAVDGHGYPLGQ